ncbi:hypothetical protein GCM10023238_26610 [Streptomyces heliomycini]
MLTGDMERLRHVVDAAIRTCREHPGFEWGAGLQLQLRANFLANRSDWPATPAATPDEALEIHRRLGDTWGVAEALSARGEARERAGAYRDAAADYEAAIEHADRLGARAHTAVLTPGWAARCWRRVRRSAASGCCARSSTTRGAGTPRPCPPPGSS